MSQLGQLEKNPPGYEQTIYEAGAPLSPFHYQLRKAWRVPYLEEKIHEQFRTHIYGWASHLAPNEWLGGADVLQTWEDPEVDVRKLGINKDDHVLAITSAGDNVLHYALAAQCARIHAVGESCHPALTQIAELQT